MIKIIDCKPIAKEWLEASANKIRMMSLRPKLIIVSLGAPDNASKIYIRNKIRACEEVGIEAQHIIFTNGTKRHIIINELDKLMNDSSCDGMIIQSPSNLDYMSVEELAWRMPSPIDVDCLSFENIGRLRADEALFLPATANGIMYLLKKLNMELSGKKVAVIGRSLIVGKPIADALTNSNCTVTLCHSKTPVGVLRNTCLDADIIISAVGQAGFISPDMVNTNCTVIDVGINRDGFGKLCGDCVSADRWNDWWTWNNNIRLTPVPGGVGVLTVAGLIDNVVKAALMKL